MTGPGPLPFVGEAAAIGTFADEVADAGKVWLVDSENGVRHWPSGLNPGLMVTVAFSAEDRVRAFLSAGGLVADHWPLALGWTEFRDTVLADLRVLGVNWQGRSARGFEVSPLPVRALVDATIASRR